jgi:hypothetical protein
VSVFPRIWRHGVLPGLFLAASLVARATDADPVNQVVLTVRAEDIVRLLVGSGFVELRETIVVQPVSVKHEREKPGATSLIHLLISPLWIREGTRMRPAFTVMKPDLNPSHGRVRRFALVQPDGEVVRRLNEMTPESRWVLTLEFGHVIPKRFTVAIGLWSGRGITPDAEFVYTASNDGQPIRSGPPASIYTDLRVSPGSSLQPWNVVEGDQILPRIDSSTVRLNRDVSHTIRFGARAEYP